MKLSELFFYTLREDVKDEESVSGKLLTRAGLVRKVGAGIYSYTPLGLKVLRKIENIVREEMDTKGACEVLMPALIPTDVYEESGRLDTFGSSMFRLEDRFNKPYALGPTHEELFTKMAYAKGNSYKNLPFNLYQIQTKYRDEARPRYGLIRVREFIMKDAYSFDADEDGLDKSYQKMYDAYHSIFQRLDLKYAVIKADTGAMGGTLSEEFQALTGIGEDTVITCDSCDFASNIEVAECKTSMRQDDSEMLELKKVNTPNVGKISDIAAFLNVRESELVKTIICKADDEIVACLVKGDREINDVKVRKLLGASEVELADEDTVVRVTNAKVGFAGPINLDLRIVVDEEVTLMKNFAVGANETDYHYINANFNRDFKGAVVGDIKNITEDDVCPICGGKLSFNPGVEVGNTFKLGTKYSKALKCLFLDKDNKQKPYEMGCYGIGIGRCLSAVVEQHNDENGIIWPDSIAPFNVIIIPANMKDEKQVEVATEIYNTLKSQGIDAAIDDRDERPGVKFKDADLLGIPRRIVVGKKVNEGLVEFKYREDSESKDMTIDDAINIF